jgi:hypothetical protein
MEIIAMLSAYKSAAALLLGVGVLAAATGFAAVSASRDKGQDKNCCEQKAACCEAKRACCTESAKAGCCAEAMKCCENNQACCDKAPECCKEGKDCCQAGKACCGEKGKEANAEASCCQHGDGEVATQAVELR